jgi:hypothetical protein
MKYNKKIIDDIINDGLWLEEDIVLDVRLGYHPDDFEKYFKTPFRSYDFDDVNFDNKIFKLSEIGFILVKSINGQLTFVDDDSKIVVVASSPTKLDLEFFKFSDIHHTKNVEISFYHHEKNKKRVEDILHFLFKEIFKKPKKENNFYMIAQGPEGLYNQRATFKPTTIKNNDFEKYYGKGFPHEKMLEFVIDDDTDNLMIIHGPPGTGKSEYLKHLFEKCEKDIIYVPPSMLAMISTPGFITYMIENKNSLIVIEDAEEILSENRNAATQNLLGMCSGLLKDVLEIKCICTINCDIGKIDPALLRKGRLHFEHLFRKLTIEEGRELAKFVGVDVDINEDITLSEIFNNAPTSVKDSFETRKIGFF